MAKEADKNKDLREPKRGKKVMTGVAVGIGSAAIVAALLYANRGRKDDRGQG